MGSIDLQRGPEAIVARDISARFEPNASCQVCQLLIWKSQWLNGHNPGNEEELPYRSMEDGMRERILNGCHLCTLLYRRGPDGEGKARTLVVAI
jgi:hypothetical protein